jgi:glycosyltransferase involved in cell wall biosynthesis
LVDALREEGNEMHIICHPDGGGPGEKNVYPVVDNERHGWDEVVYETVQRIKPDIVHIQHEFGLYRTSNDNAGGLFRPLFRWKTEGTPPVVATYHSVYTELSPMISAYMDVMQRLVDAGIVHAEYQWAHLHTNLGRIVENVYVIPHGASVRKPPAKEEAKYKLDLKGKKVLGLLGWFTPTKGFHRIVSMWGELYGQLGDDTALVLAGDARLGDAKQIDYKNTLTKLVEKSSARDSIKLLFGSFSPEEYEHILSSFDAMVMPYTFASQSGNLAHSFSLGVPVVASGLEGLKAEIEASGAGIAVEPGNDTEMKRAIITILKDDALRTAYRKRALRYVRMSIGWNITAKKHMKLYRNVLKAKQAVPRTLRSRALLQ